MKRATKEQAKREQLRRFAVAHSLGHCQGAAAHPQDLLAAIRRLGYVQADPLRAPARAQDLILRQRVPDYRVDELDQRYAELPLREEMLHNYGFVPQEHLGLLHPRRLSPRWQAFMAGHGALRRRVLGYLQEHEEAHPRALERLLGSGPRANGWGSSSSASTLMLEALHREGRARVRRREAGVRIYAAALPLPATEKLPPHARADGLIRLFINLYAPLPLRSLTQLLTMLGERKARLDYGARIERMVKRGEIVREQIDGLVYLWPGAAGAPDQLAEPDDRVRLLAPFDPLVWDRRRFEHLWGWAYRFEAYTPPAKRKLGYYALPMLWRAQVIGWANARIAGANLLVDFGFAPASPAMPATRAARLVFKRELDAEIERLARFLGR